MPLSLQILETIEQLKEMARLEEEIWKTAPVPLHQTLTAAKNGGIVIGAYMDGKLVGFVYSFPGFRNGEVYLCSHMMGIAESFRDRGLGYRLKMKQAEEARRRGYRVIRWTYDPLQSRNGYLNLAKLGALGVEYVENCYGEMNDALNGQLPSDRFIVEWRLDERPTGERSLAKADLLKASSLTVLEAGQRADGLLQPVPRDIDETAAPLLLTAVPLDFPQLKEQDFALALEWRVATRALFQRLLVEGWIAAGAWRCLEEGVLYYIWKRRGERWQQKGEEE
ncbi:GNAT family N-acetyltransferase [Geobacillus thermocatenulatus]|uniref:GNAT family N-acetyltransferase n=1 Tax=Geobacillus thermocatenulatus TaxID=33938 RepID=A0A226Q534_9BACL|nr:MULTISPECIES: GNAT family N-acetyltransferase [Geobacillus]AST00194.1 GNAT family N-acetyltransferase [Geobacillus thermocatenulatus]KLR72092.1 GCN5 family acetyltransferase [Geobacillus sp. T6]OXB86572.1 GNAT family N-acetyltransferase [Geobacillus thermocatenulatus]RAN29968.1 GCN5 family acetyltransferase [Geobacillus sp. A8]